ncbi:MAG: DUF2868 domain-containing protein [Desulforegulaceae bacterium]|nr:DUF2868 domain-containing protein [Desulforegulaceae bacterium]
MGNTFKSKWKLKDLIDFDYFLFLRKNNDKDRRSSDREFYLDKIAPFANFESSNFNQKDLLYLWASAKKTELIKISNPQLPGEWSVSAVKLIVLIFSVLFFLIGLFTAFGFLSYSGVSPINVFYYFGIFAGFQILILPFAFIPFFFRNEKSFFKKFSLFLPVAGFFKIAFQKIFKKFFHKSSSDPSVLYSFDFLKYSQPLFWLFFTISQGIIALFSTGVLIGTLIKVTGSDLAFGWQTTLNPGAEYIYKIVSFIASPWAWFIPESMANPSMDQIIGSKIILKEGIASLSTQDMTSWWPFLCFSVLFYSIIPRFIIMLVAYFNYSRTIKKYPKDSSELRQLSRSLLRPEFDFKPSEKNLEKDLRSVTKPDFLKSEKIKENLNPTSTGVRLILPEDIYSEEVIDFIEKIIAKKFGYLLYPVINSTGVSEFDQPWLEENIKKSGKKFIIMLCLEAWQPPLKQTIEYIENLRKISGKNCEILVALVGKPGKEDLFLDVEKNDFELWQFKIDSIKDPLVSLTELKLE